MNKFYLYYFWDVKKLCHRNLSKNIRLDIMTKYLMEAVLIIADPDPEYVRVIYQKGKFYKNTSLKGIERIQAKSILNL